MSASQYYKVTSRVGVPHRHEVAVTVPLVGPAGPAGEGGGAATWDELTGKPATFPPTAHKATHATGGTDALTAADIGAAPSTGISPSAITGTAVVDSDARLTDARTPTAHSSTHHTGGSDPLTPANIGAAPAVNVIELTADGTTTITTAQLPARGIAYIEGGASFTVNLPTPDKRQSGLSFSIKTEHEGGVTGNVFITVVHDAVNLLTSYELAEAEGSIDFRWDGYRWTYSFSEALVVRNANDTFTSVLSLGTANRNISLPDASGTIALTNQISKTYATFTATDNQPPASNFAVLDTRNSIAVLGFRDTTADDAAIFVGVMPEAAVLSSGLKVRIHWMSETQTSGNVRWQAHFQRCDTGTDLDSDSFDTNASNEATGTASSTLGAPTVTEITCGSGAIDGIVAGDAYRLRITREQSDSTNDTMTDRAQVFAVEVRSAA